MAAIVIAIWIVWIAAFLLFISFFVWGVAGWFIAAKNWFGMTANATEKAQPAVRLIPWWFMLDGMLTDEGTKYRRQVLVGLRRFLTGWAGSGLVVGSIWLVAYLLGVPMHGK